jgi:hypothetical protein
LYDFLVPYRRYTVAVFIKSFVNYLHWPASYLTATTLPDASTMFRALECMLVSSAVLWQFLSARLVGAGMTVSQYESCGRECPNGWKARKTGKEKLLHWVATMMELAGDDLNKAILEIAGNILNGHGGCALLRTHSVQCVIF